MKWVELFFDRYGPYAFGLMSLMMIWLLIVAPQLDARTLDFEQQQKMVEQMGVMVDQMRASAVIMERTADRLGDICNTLPRGAHTNGQ